MIYFLILSYVKPAAGIQTLSVNRQLAFVRFFIYFEQISGFSRGVIEKTALFWYNIFGTIVMSEGVDCRNRLYRKQLRRLKMKAVKTTFIIASAVLAVILMAFALWIFLGVSEESTSWYSKGLNIELPNIQNEYKRISAIKNACKEDCSTKDLKKIECNFNGYENILAKNGEVIYSFEELTDDSKEGGNVAVANIYFDTGTEKLYKIDFYNGAGKAYSIGGENLDVEAWTLSVSDIVDMFVLRYTEKTLSEVQGARLNISIKNDVAFCTLFSDQQKGYIEKMTFDLK